MVFGPSGASVVEFSSSLLVVRTLLSPHPRGDLSWIAVLERTVSSDKQFHPRLRKLKGKLWTKQNILLKLSVATNCDEEQFISSFTTVANQELALPAGGQRRRRRRDVSQFWWLWAGACEQMCVCFGSKPSVWASCGILFVLVPAAVMATKESPSQDESKVGRVRVSALLLPREMLGWQQVPHWAEAVDHACAPAAFANAK